MNKLYFSIEITDKLKNTLTSNNSSFIEGDYTFDKNENGNTYSKDLTFIGYSRIDGLPIFSMDKPLDRPPLGTYSFKDKPITNIQLVSRLGDHLTKYRYLDGNKDKLIEFLMKHHNINTDDLLSEEATSSIIREIRLEKLLDI